MTMKRHFWSELTSDDFTGLDPERTIAVLPVAAIEQHGPHLPVGTDTIIAEGMIAETIVQLSRGVEAIFLPVQTIGKSNEHLKFPGTITLTAETALKAWVEIGEGVSRAGIRKLAFINSHGGNTDLIGIAARELRVRFAMFAVHTHWMRFGYPHGLYEEEEIAHGLHGGDIETSLMLHFRPILVKRDAIANFAPASVAMPADFKRLRASAPHGFAWMAQDLNPAGAIGDATRATAEKGAATAAHQATGFVELLRDMAAFGLDRLSH
jgi:creatinine amidohydrolase